MSELPQPLRAYIYEQTERVIKSDVSSFEVLSSLLQGITKYVYGYIDNMCLLLASNPQLKLKYVKLTLVEKHVPLLVDFDAKIEFRMMKHTVKEITEQLHADFQDKFSTLCSTNTNGDKLHSFSMTDIDIEAQMLHDMYQQIPESSGEDASIKIVSFVDVLYLIHHLHASLLKPHVGPKFLHHTMNDLFGAYMQNETYRYEDVEGFLNNHPTIERVETPSPEPPKNEKKRKLPDSLFAAIKDGTHANKEQNSQINPDLFDTFVTEDLSGCVLTFFAKQAITNFIDVVFRKCILGKVQMMIRSRHKARAVVTTGTDVLRILHNDHIVYLMCKGIKIKYHTSELHFQPPINW